MGILAGELFLEVTHRVTNIGIHFHPVLHEATGMQNGAMVASAECITDAVQRVPSLLTILLRVIYAIPESF